MTKLLKNKLFRDILPGLLLALSIILSLLLFQSNNIFSIIVNSEPNSEVIPAAQDMLRSLGFDPDNFSFDARREINNTLLEFIQKENIAQDVAVTLPYFYWSIDVAQRENVDDSLRTFSLEIGPLSYRRISGWVGTVQSVYFEYAPDSRLIAMDITFQDSLTIRSDLPEDAAERAAKLFVSQSALVDTSDLRIGGRTTSQKKGYSDVTYTFERVSQPAAGITETFLVTIAGTMVSNYRERVIVNLTERTMYQIVGEAVVNYLEVILIIFIVFLMIYYFFKKFKHDELGYRQGLWIGVTGGIATAGYSVVTWNNWIEGILGVVVGGGFLMVILALAFSVGESIARDVWREKLRGLDTLIQGKINVREIGEFFIRGVGLACAGFLLFLGLDWLAQSRFETWLELPLDEYPEGSSAKTFLSIVFGAVLVIIMTIIFYTLVWGSVIKRRITGRTSLLLLMALALVYAGVSSVLLKPIYIAVLVFVPTSLLWAWFYFREDFTTVFVMVSLGLLLMNVREILLIGSSDAFLYAGILFGIAAAIYGAGLYVKRSSVSITEVEMYVPEYVIRMAEKDRIMKELEIARDVQKKILPATMPEYPSAEIDAICQPAQEVGGDYFDFFPYGDHRLGLIIGDVSGKGIPAAFYMTMVKGIVKTLAKKYVSPKEILCDLNRIFYENAPKSVFISVIYGVFDFKNRELRYARAGHLPLLVWCERQRKTVQNIPNGIAVGLDKGELFDKYLEEHTCHLDPGDLYLFYTDGISEASNGRGEEFGEERLEKVLNKCAVDSPKILLEEIRDTVLRFTGKSGRQDDITAIAVQIKTVE